MLKPNIQLFAEPADPAPAEPNNPAPAGKVFTEDYVSGLRRESAGYRTTAKTYESTLRTMLGLKDGEEMGDLNARVAAFQQAQQKQLDDTITAANQRLISAELKALQGYDHKLLAKVIDLSKVKVDNQGNITGIKEAAEAAAKEFPAVNATGRPQYAPTNPAENMPTGSGEITREAFLKMGYRDRLKLKQERPEIYDKFKGVKENG